MSPQCGAANQLSHYKSALLKTVPSTSAQADARQVLMAKALWSILAVWSMLAHILYYLLCVVRSIQNLCFSTRVMTPAFEPAFIVGTEAGFFLTLIKVVM
jgi:hypothetical protein